MKNESIARARCRRRSQLERLDKSTSPGRPRVQLPPGLPLPPALDARLVELLHEGDEREEELAEQAMREKRAYADILWAEEQLSDIRAVVERARLATPAGKKGGKKASSSDLPDGWEELSDDDTGATYFYNSRTEEVSIGKHAEQVRKRASERVSQYSSPCSHPARP